MSLAFISQGEIYPSEEAVRAGITVLDEVGNAALQGETVELDSVATGELQTAASTYIDPETPIRADTQADFMRSILKVVAPEAELPDMSGRQWASFLRRTSHHPELRFVAAPLMDRMVERQALVERARTHLPNDFTPHAELTALRAPDAGTVIADLLEDLSPDGRHVVEREGNLYVARYKSPEAIDPEYLRELVEAGYLRRDLTEAGRTLAEEVSDGVPLVKYRTPLRSGPVNRVTYREDMLEAGGALQAADGTPIAVGLLDVQQNASRVEASMGELYPRISPLATPETHIVGEILRQVAHKPDMNMTINGVNEMGWMLTDNGELEDHPRYVGTLRFRTDPPDERPDHGHRIGSYARTWESKRSYMAVRMVLAAFLQSRGDVVLF